MAGEVLTVQSATLADDACGTLRLDVATISGARATASRNGNCYRFTLTATDNVGNVASLTSTVKVDTTAPVAPTDLLHGPLERQHVRRRYDPLLPPVGRRHVHGERDRRIGSRDRASPSYTFSPLSSFARAHSRRATRSTSRSTARAPAAAPQSVSAVNNAGVSSTPATPFTVHRTAAPRPAACSRSTRTRARSTVAIAKTDFTDADLGHRDERRHPLERAGALVAGRLPGSAATPARHGRRARPTRFPTDGQCYEYTLTGTDNVGNTATFQTLVLVDTTGPTGGSVSLRRRAREPRRGQASTGSPARDAESGIALRADRARDGDAHRLDVRRASEPSARSAAPWRSSPTSTRASRPATATPTGSSSRTTTGVASTFTSAVGREAHERLADHGSPAATRPAPTSSARPSGSARPPRTPRSSSS